jgi:hypothetical protein
LLFSPSTYTDARHTTCDLAGTAGVAIGLAIVALLIGCVVTTNASSRLLATWL